MASSRCRNSDPLRTVVVEIQKGTLESLKTSITPSLEPKLVERLISRRVPRNNSLLVLAIQHKQKDMLLYLMDNYKVNVEQETSTVIEGGHPVEGATPLWTASTLGHLDLVKELVDRGADIEHTTDSKSSPLRGAAFDGHIDVVKYLVKKGANIDKPNQVGQSPLTIAAAMKQIETVKYLIEHGANVHHKGHNGDMPLHVAVESGSGDVTKILVEAGAKNIANDVGYTPAILACCYGHHDILEFLDSKFELDCNEKYNCYCLLFSKEVLNSDNAGALKWVTKAITIRSMDKFTLDITKSDPIYDDVQEPTNLDEAKRIINDDIKSFYLCSVYCERILGPIHPTTPFYIRISGDMALEEQAYDKCMQLWLRSLKFDEAARMAYELQIIEDLLFSVRGFAMMIEAGYFPQFEQHFDWGIREFHLSKASKISKNDVVYCLCRLLAVWLMAINASGDREYKHNECEKFRKCAKALYDLNINGETPLLVACLKNLPPPAKDVTHFASASSAISHSKLPLHKVISLFLDFGCLLNSEDEFGNFLLHLAVMLNEDSSYDCVRTLVEAGAHIDAVNYNNETPLQQTSNSYAANRAKIRDYLTTSEKTQITLRCLCAKTLIRNVIPYKNVLPNYLVSYVSEHDCGID